MSREDEQALASSWGTLSWILIFGWSNCLTHISVLPRPRAHIRFRFNMTISQRQVVSRESETHTTVLPPTPPLSPSSTNHPPALSSSRRPLLIPSPASRPSAAHLYARLRSHQMNLLPPLVRLMGEVNHRRNTSSSAPLIIPTPTRITYRRFPLSLVRPCLCAGGLPHRCPHMSHPESASRRPAR